jgi:hypothetical protein
MILMHNFCLGKLRFDVLPIAIGFHDFNKVNLCLIFTLMYFICNIGEKHFTIGYS